MKLRTTTTQGNAGEDGLAYGLGRFAWSLGLLRRCALAAGRAASRFEILRLFFGVCGLFWATSALALQSGDFTYTDNGTSVTITYYTGAGGAVAIPSSIGGHPVTAIDGWAFYYQFSLTSITIPDTVTSIGAFAFQGCRNMTSITLPSSLTSIGDYAFYYCDKLTSVTIPGGVTTIGTYGFNNCTGLTRVNFLGNPPTLGADAFGGVTAQGYYRSGINGYTSPFGVSVRPGASV